MDAIPFVSVIAPAYNAKADIRHLVESLLKIDYPKDRLEIIVVDNGSTDDTVKILREYPLQLLEEKEIQSSYAARNRAVVKAKGEVLAFTDSDCRVTPSWVKEGVRALEMADLAAGKIEFFYSTERGTAAELFDSLQHMQNDDLVNKFSGAATANLFVKAPVFKSVGLFREDVRSGGDMLWTTKTTSSGFKIVYTPDAVVKHPTRRLGELLRKAFRLGTGHFELAMQQGKPVGGIMIEAIRSLLPPRMAPVQEKIAAKNPALSSRVLGVWWVAYLYRAARGLGLIWRMLSR
ncbi:MAG: glycosyltransferase [Bacteroidota bacterium]